MDVMSARVHHTRNRRRERKPRRFLNREGIDVSAERDHGRGARAPWNTRDGAGLSDAPNVGHPDVGQRRQQARRRISLGERQLRMTMKLAPERHEAIPELR
jgi:hypothetical protein